MDGMQQNQMKGLSQLVQSMGRNGDTVLAHITPEEAGLLKAAGGSGTINPATGLMEFWGGPGGPSGDVGGRGDGTGAGGDGQGSGNTGGETGGGNDVGVGAGEPEDRGPQSPTGGTTYGGTDFGGGLGNPGNLPGVSVGVMGDGSLGIFGGTDNAVAANAIGQTLADRLAVSRSLNNPTLGAPTSEEGRVTAAQSKAEASKAEAAAEGADEGEDEGLGLAATIGRAIATGLAGLIGGPIAGGLVGLGLGLFGGQSPAKSALGGLTGALSAGTPVGQLAGLGLSALGELATPSDDPTTAADESKSFGDDIGQTMSTNIGNIAGRVSDVASDPVGSAVGAAMGAVSNAGQTVAGAVDGVSGALSGLSGPTAESVGNIGDPSGGGQYVNPVLLASAASPAKPQSTSTDSKDDDDTEVELRRRLNPAYPTTQAGLLEASLRGIDTPRYIMASTGGGIESLYDDKMHGKMFSGRVKGGKTVDSDGMSDDVYMKILSDKEDDPSILAVSPDEYVLAASDLALLGNGSNEAGARRVDQFVADLREKAYNKGQQPKQLNGLQELASLLPSNAQQPA